MTFALGDLHKKIKKYCNFEGGYFFEVGANDGISQSNTAYLERNMGWTGILVEPVPHKFVECKINRPNSQVFNAALVSEDFKNDVVELKYSNLMTTSSLSKIDREAHKLRGENFLGAEIGISGQTFYAPARTTQSIIEEAGWPQIDFFSLDVEGAELDVLQGIDFKSVRPKMFLIELRDKEPVQNLLNSNDYELIEALSHHDYLFIDRR